MTSTSTRDLVSQPYKYGFVTEIETEKIAKGLSEEVVRLISAKKEEPDFLLEFRLKAFRHWLTLEEPDWAALGYPPIDYQDIVYYAAPKQQEAKKASLDEVDPKLLETFDKLGIPLTDEQLLDSFETHQSTLQGEQLSTLVYCSGGKPSCFARDEFKLLQVLDNKLEIGSKVGKGSNQSMHNVGTPQ